jgi:type I restriction enzyme S subunit
LIRDGSHGTHNDVAEGVAFLSAKDVRDGTLLIPEDCRRIARSEYDSLHKSYEIERDDILLTIVGSIGRCCLVSGDEPRFTVQRSVGIIRPSGIAPPYLFQFFRSAGFQQTLKELTNASAQGGVYLGSLAQAPIEFPPSVPEQTKIAEILSTVDRAIEQTEALIAKQQRLKTGLMQDLLTRGIDPHGNLRSEQTHPFKDSPLGRIPVEWEAGTLGQMAEFLSGYAFKNQELTEHGWRVVRISNLHKPDFPYWHYEGPIRDSWVIRSGDILFSWAGVASSIDCVRYEGEDALLNQHIYNFKFADELTKSFVYLFLQYYLPILRNEIEGGAGQLHLTKDKIQSIRIPNVPTLEMEAIVSALEGVEKSLASYRRQLSKTRVLKTALMQDLLTGRKRVTTLLDRKGADK